MKEISIGTKTLAGMVGSNKPVELRPLTVNEIETDAKSRATVCEVRSRFKLFKIFEMNYNDWTAYQRRLLVPGAETNDNLLMLDRLMFNFLTTAYALMEHFKGALRRGQKKNPDRIKQYEDMVNQLCSDTWAVAFFLDYRNYVQHRGLPIALFNRNGNAHSITISITHHADQLLSSDNREWKCCRLKPEHGELDLITLTRDYYLALQSTYRRFISRYFYPELVDIASFYRGLTQEVQKQYPGSRMIFMTRKKETRLQNTVSTDWEFEYPPNALYDELGISI